LLRPSNLQAVASVVRVSSAVSDGASPPPEPQA